MMRVKISCGVLAVSLLCASVVLPRTVFNSGEGTFIAGKIVGRVETILNDLSLSADKKKSLLEGALIHAEQLHLATLSQKIRTHLSLATVQADSLGQVAEEKRSVRINEPSQGEELPLQAAVLGESDEESVSVELSIDEISSFGTQVIEDAANYSDRLSIVGVPSVSQHRMASLALFVRQLRAHKEVYARAQDAVAVCKKIYQLLETNKTLLSLIASFKKHLSTKYEQAEEGVEGDINFKIFEVVAYPTKEEGMTVEDVIGDFLTAYNSYVSPEHHFTSEELSFPA